MFSTHPCIHTLLSMRHSVGHRDTTINQIKLKNNIICLFAYSFAMSKAVVGITGYTKDTK